MWNSTKRLFLRLHIFSSFVSEFGHRDGMHNHGDFFLHLYSYDVKLPSADGLFETGRNEQFVVLVPSQCPSLMSAGKWALS